jgi:hypothetical protein
MTKLVAVQKRTHSQKVWRRPAGYQFVAQEPLAPIVLVEAMHVGAGMPIVFVEQTGGYAPMAMMSPTPKQNFFVGPDGRWLGGYVPAQLRCYPFRLAQPTGSEKMVLCVDEDSGLVRDAGEKGESFFTADGEPSQAVSKVAEVLRQIEGNRRATDLAMASLAEAGVIERWPLQAEVEGKKTALKGLHRVNESALARLDGDVIVKLHKASALRLAYAQVMSMLQLTRFHALAGLQQQLARVPKIKPEDIFQMEESSDTIRFN